MSLLQRSSVVQDWARRALLLILLASPLHAQVLTPQTVFWVDRADTLQPHRPPAVWHDWWVQLKGCALKDAKGNFEKIRVYFPAAQTLRHSFYGPDVEIFGITFNAMNLIIIPARDSLNRSLVQHEMLHVWLRTPGCSGLGDAKCHPQEFDWCATP